MKRKARRGCLALKYLQSFLPRSGTLTDLRFPLVRSATLADLRPLVRGHSPYESAGKDSLMCKHNVNLSPPPLHCSFSYATI